MGWVYSIFGGLAEAVRLGMDTLHRNLVDLDLDVRIGIQVASVSLMHPRDFHSHGRT